MKRLAAFVAFASIGLMATAELPQQPWVTHAFASAERDGRAVPVRPEHLSAEVDGRPVPILRVIPSDGPATILLLVDLTWSATRGQHPQLPRLREPGVFGRTGGFGPLAQFPGLIAGLDKAFLPWLRPDDRLFVGSFAGRHLSFSRDAALTPSDRLAAFKETINPAAAPLDGWFGAAPIWDAVASAAGRLANERPPRAIVLITDGEASGNRISLAEGIRSAVEQGVAVHVVCAKSWWDPKQYPAADTLIDSLAEETGGLVRSDDRLDRLPWSKPAQVFGDLIAAVHDSVQLQLDPSDVPPGVWRLKVRTSVPGVALAAPEWVARRLAPAKP